MSKSARSARVQRNTKETQIALTLNLDGSGQADIHTGVGFFDHMLDQIARHGHMDLVIKANGDLHVDAHHTVEDVGITLGQAFSQVVGDKRGLVRYGLAYVPLDESLSRVVVDLSGRPGLFYNVKYSRPRIGQFDVDLVQEFLIGFVNHAAVTVHVDNLKGSNSHHQCESVFKALGRALMAAVSFSGRGNDIPSTKGVL